MAVQGGQYAFRRALPSKKHHSPKEVLLSVVILEGNHAAKLATSSQELEAQTMSHRCNLQLSQHGDMVMEKE